jgi:cobalt/nickel transport system permease protein
VLERWSRGASGLHRRDPRAKLLGLLAVLVAVATAARGVPALSAMLLAALIAGLAWARLPVGAALLRACVVFAFTLPFALFSLLGGDPARSLSLVLKSYVSSLSVLLVVGTTPMPLLLRGLESARAPRFLLMVAQFLYRYLFVIAEEAQHMRKAALSRGGFARRAGFRAAGGALAVLFARSYARSVEIHRAMLARGFNGRLPAPGKLSFRLPDAVFAAAAAGLACLARLAAARIA